MSGLKVGKKFSHISIVLADQDIVDFREHMLYESASTTIGKVTSRLIMLSTGPAVQQFPSAGGCTVAAQYWMAPYLDEMFFINI